MNLSANDKGILDDMGLLSISCDSFLIPGPTALKLMLVDGGLNESTANLLIHELVQTTVHT